MGSTNAATSAMTSVNMNVIARAVLTERGAEILRESFRRQLTPHRDVQAVEQELACLPGPGEAFEAPLWQILARFGPSMPLTTGINPNSVFFENNAIDIDVAHPDTVYLLMVNEASPFASNSAAQWRTHSAHWTRDGAQRSTDRRFGPSYDSELADYYPPSSKIETMRIQD